MSATLHQAYGRCMVRVSMIQLSACRVPRPASVSRTRAAMVSRDIEANALPLQTERQQGWWNRSITRQGTVGSAKERQRRATATPQQMQNGQQARQAGQ